MASKEQILELTQGHRAHFQDTVWTYYRQHARALPWRESSASPYHILVSELMLQQTQVERVVPKYKAFLDIFPTIDQLAAVSLGRVLQLWQGLGYNRRAKYLHETAKIIATRYGGRVPETVEELVALPGVGYNTAAAIRNYAFNKPTSFVETNIRTVYIYHFFSKQHEVYDKEILALVEQTIDQEAPREWFWALMDYGSFLKTRVGNVARQSRHYQKQSAFAGSDRQIRGAILRVLAQQQDLGLAMLSQTVSDSRLETILESMIKEGLVVQKKDKFCLP